MGWAIEAPRTPRTTGIRDPEHIVGPNPADDGVKILRADFPDAEYPHRDLTRKIIGCAISVHRELGPGYLESVYENALAYELRKQGVCFDRQKPVKVLYDGHPVGEHRADLVVENKVVVELKHVDTVVPKHVAQVISTLKAFRLKVGLLINFNEARLVDGVTRVIF